MTELQRTILTTILAKLMACHLPRRNWDPRTGSGLSVLRWRYQDGGGIPLGSHDVGSTDTASRQRFHRALSNLADDGFIRRLDGGDVRLTVKGLWEACWIVGAPMADECADTVCTICDVFLDRGLEPDPETYVDERFCRCGVDDERLMEGTIRCTLLAVLGLLDNRSTPRGVAAWRLTTEAIRHLEDDTLADLLPEGDDVEAWPVMSFNDWLDDVVEWKRSLAETEDNKKELGELPVSGEGWIWHGDEDGVEECYAMNGHAGS